MDLPVGDVTFFGSKEVSWIPLSVTSMFFGSKEVSWIPLSVMSHFCFINSGERCRPALALLCLRIVINSIFSNCSTEFDPGPPSIPGLPIFLCTTTSFQVQIMKPGEHQWKHDAPLSCRPCIQPSRPGTGYMSRVNALVAQLAPPSLINRVEKAEADEGLLPCREDLNQITWKDWFPDREILQKLFGAHWLG